MFQTARSDLGQTRTNGSPQAYVAHTRTNVIVMLNPSAHILRVTRWGSPPGFDPRSRAAPVASSRREG
jgi:hypothetical protein